jgi:hypothetical protein
LSVPGNQSSVGGNWTASIIDADADLAVQMSQMLSQMLSYQINYLKIRGYELKELQSPYNPVFTPEKCSLRLQNDYFWQVS